jgi:polysaccharide export outer membrane protein
MVPVPLQLSAGDALEITFPGATNLSGIHRIGPDGMITMPLVGQVGAAGKTAQEVQADLMRLYSKELQDKEVIVGIVGSANLVYVTGSVGRPGRVELNRPMTALEAIMECGGFTETANRKKVTVVRYEGDHNTFYTLNLEPLLTGGPVPPFYVRPKDIIHVPAKVQWF